MTEYIMFSHGEYSDYSVLDVLEVPEGCDTTALLQQFRDEFMPDLKAKADPTITPTMWGTKQYNLNHSVIYDIVQEGERKVEAAGLCDERATYPLEQGFCNWLVRNHNYKAISYDEIHLDFREPL